jgi:aryl-alcohol dehydrogenase-like predicted oxidoreductase
MTFHAPAGSELSDLTKYTYGTTRLGDEKIPFADRVKTARAAMDAGVWFHTSHTYGDTFRVLRAAFDEDRAHVPPAIFKIGWDSIDEMRDVIRQNLEPLGLERMAIGQLCLGQRLAAEFRTGGPCYDGFRRIREEGLVDRYVLEVWPWNSDVALDALRGGYPEGVVDGYIFYFNPLQRFVSNELFDLLQERNQPIIAMRTVGGGLVHRQRDVPGAAPDYLRARAEQVAPLFERSGCRSWTEFAVRYVFGFPLVRTTVGSTSRVENLQEFLDAAQSRDPLPDDIQAAMQALQRSWAVEHDRLAAPWSCRATSCPGDARMASKPE